LLALLVPIVGFNPSQSPSLVAVASLVTLVKGTAFYIGAVIPLVALVLAVVRAVRRS
jgi:hypothetical protein